MGTRSSHDRGPPWTRFHKLAPEFLVDVRVNINSSSRNNDFPLLHGVGDKQQQCQVAVMEAHGTSSPVAGVADIHQRRGETQGMIRDETTMGMIALSIAETFGKERISRELATSMRTLLPGAEFVRVSLRSGTGLFVTDNLLKDGYCMVNLVSLKHSLSAQSMRSGSMLQIKVPDYTYDTPYGQDQESRKLGIIGVAPVMVKSLDLDDAPDPLAVGSLIVGLCSSEFDAQTVESIHALSQALGESLLTVGLEHVSHLAHLLLLRDQDTEFLGGEEPLQDLPWDVPRPFGAQDYVDSLEIEIDPPIRRTGSESGEESDGSDDDFLMMYLRDAGLAGSSIGPDTDLEDDKSSEGKQEERPVKEVSAVECDVEELSPSSHGMDKGDAKERFIRQSLPDAGMVRTVVVSLMCIMVHIGHALVSGKEAMSLFSILAFLAACTSLGFSGVALMGRRVPGTSVDKMVIIFAVLNTLPSMMNFMAGKDDYSVVKRDLLRSILFFESTLLLCLERKSYALPAHIGACIALAVASTVAF